MAKADFCFTFYDGDATRDISHMNRTERGSYFDILISIRKFGHLTTDQIKRILSNDFESTFPAIELILKVDGDGKFYIEWLENSLTKAKKHSEKQRENVNQRYTDQPEIFTDVIPNLIFKTTNQLPNTQKNLPLGNGDGYVNEDKEENKNEHPTFEDFWNAYQKKVGDKTKLVKKWDKILKADKLKIMAYIPRYIDSQPDKKYRKNPETFLNNSSWNDEIIQNTKIDKIQFPNTYSIVFEQELKDYETIRKYWQHLRDLGWTTRQEKGQTVWINPLAR